MFQGCDGLVSIVVEKGNTQFDSRDNCNAIIRTNLDTLICGCKTTVIPKNVIYIDDYAFSYCTGLSAITIPNGVEVIGKYAFEGCTSLTSVILPDTITEIGEGAFEGCSGASIIIPGGEIDFGEDCFQHVFNIQRYGYSKHIGKLILDVFHNGYGAKTENGYIDGFFVYESNKK